MKRSKAIEILELMAKAPDWVFDADNRDAIKLAIKDIEYVQTIRAFPHLVDEIPLPGETEASDSP